jgi:hypothetical protein
MIYAVLRWLMALLRIKEDIIGRKGEPYLSRWTLWGGRFTPGPKVFLHYFHRSDWDEAAHDHPWPFTSLILWGGYREHLPGVVARDWTPGRIVRHRAEDAHWIELYPRTPAVTLVFCGAKVRSWGFWCKSGWTPWRDHAKRMEATNYRQGCE